MEMVVEENQKELKHWEVAIKIINGKWLFLRGSPKRGMGSNLNTVFISQEALKDIQNWPNK